MSQKEHKTPIVQGLQSSLLCYFCEACIVRKSSCLVYNVSSEKCNHILTIMDLSLIYFWIWAIYSALAYRASVMLANVVASVASVVASVYSAQEGVQLHGSDWHSRLTLSKHVSLPHDWGIQSIPSTHSRYPSQLSGSGMSVPSVQFCGGSHGSMLSIIGRHPTGKKITLLHDSAT